MTSATPEMKVSAIAPWFGSKRNLAPVIVETLGRHRAYWEPFCGSLAVLLAKTPVAMETVNDLHGDLINLARVLADETTALALYARLSRFVMHEDLYHEAAERWRQRGRLAAPDAPDIDSATDFMVCSWIGRNGVAGTESYNQGFSVRYTKNGGHAATRWCSAVESIPAWHARLRSVVILNRDGFEIIDRIEDAAGVVIYIDPPYLRKGARYVHDFAGEDHDRLAVALRRFKATRVVVSYYAEPELEGLYPGWARVEINVSKALASQNKRDTANETRATEVLLVNQAAGLFG